VAHNQRLSTLEASFLAIEHPGLPMHVAGLVMVEPGEPVTLKELRTMLASRLRRLPRFRQRVLFSLLGLERAEWTPPGRVDLDAHVFHHTLPRPGRQSQLYALCGHIHETLLERDRPLWEIHLIDGLQAGGQALLIKTHHAITDGIAGIEVAEALFDPAEPAHKPAPPPTRFADRPAPSPFAALQSVLGVAFTAARGPFVPPGPFNGPVGAHRTFATATLSMDAVRRAKRLLGGSVDDVVVATVAAGLRRYLHEVGYPDVPSALRAMLPVSTRPSSSRGKLGNHVTTVFVDLPLHTGDLSELVRSVATSKSLLRSAHAAAGMSLLIEAVGLLPNRLHGLAVRIAAGLPYGNLILSDIPGPDAPLALLGRRLGITYPMMPLAPGIGLSVAAVSLAGVMGVGITADPGLMPKPALLARAIEWVMADFDRAHSPHHVIHPRAHTRRAA
jgi:diacylglycerol O-acyltransferase